MFSQREACQWRATDPPCTSDHFLRGRNCAETKQSRPLSLPYDVRLRIDKEPIMESHCSLMVCFWKPFDLTFFQSYFIHFNDIPTDCPTLTKSNISNIKQYNKRRKAVLRWQQCSQLRKTKNGRCAVGHQLWANAPARRTKHFSKRKRDSVKSRLTHGGRALILQDIKVQTLFSVRTLR